MKETDLNRRDFSKLTMAAFGGMVAGTMAGCSKEDPAPAKTTGGTPAPKDDNAAANNNGAEPHACRGLNSCKDEGASGENGCRGQGTCFTVATHTCATQNTCKFLGGCKDNPGSNDCSGMGGCGVPITDAGKWQMARDAFEKRLPEGKTAGEAPAAG